MATNSSAVEHSSQLKIEMALPAAFKSESPIEAKGTKSTPFRRQLDRQLVLLPVGSTTRLPGNHLVYLVIDMVGSFDLSGILAKYENKARVGRPAYDPTMMLTLILYCYCTGATSARAIERLCHESVPCRVITGNQVPDHDTICNFLLLHRAEFDDIFQQVLRQADGAGLVKLDHVALDGSKLHASASKHKAMSYARMCAAVTRLPQECAQLESQIAELTNQGISSKTKALKRDVKFKKKKLAKIKTYKKKLERRAKQKAEIEAKEKKKLKKQGRKIRKIPNPKTALPKPTDQINFTDPDSRIMGHRGGAFEQCYNVQIVVDDFCQMIVAQDVVQHGNDKDNLLAPMFAQVYTRLGRHPLAGSADSGYFSEENIGKESLSMIELFVPPDRETHPRTSSPGVGRIPINITAADRMRRKLSTTRGKALYAMRKCIVEPVYGQVKESVLEFDQFSWRGLANVRNQWALVCAAHNLLKIHRATLREKSLAQAFHLDSA
jgi:transposase